MKCSLRVVAFSVLLLLTLHSSLSYAAEAASDFEKPPELMATIILKPELLRSRVHSVDQKVQNDGFMNNFTVYSPYGDFLVRGNVNLETMVQELHAVADMERRYGSSNVVADAAYETGKGIVTGPIRAIEKTAATVTNRKKLVDTVESIPGGVWNLFSSAASAVGSGAEFIFDSGRSVFESKEERKKRTSDRSSLERAERFISKTALDYLGYNKAAREILKEYSLDPYTTNSVVRAEVRRIASIKTTVGVAGKFVPGIPSIPYIGTFNRYVGKAEDISAYEDPEKIQDLNDRILNVIGTQEQQKKGWDYSFRKNNHFSPVMRGLFLQNVAALGAIPGIPLLIEAASNAKNREEGMFYVLLSKELREHHEKRERFTKIIFGGRLPAGVTKSGTLYVSLPIDYLVWSKEVATVFRSLSKGMKLDKRIRRFEIEATGDISPRCRAELQALGANQIRTQAGI